MHRTVVREDSPNPSDLALEGDRVDYYLDEADFPLSAEDEESVPVDWEALAPEIAGQVARLRATFVRERLMRAS